MWRQHTIYAETAYYLCRDGILFMQRRHTIHAETAYFTGRHYRALAKFSFYFLCTSLLVNFPTTGNRFERNTTQTNLASQQEF